MAEVIILPVIRIDRPPHADGDGTTQANVSDIGAARHRRERLVAARRKMRSLLPCDREDGE